MAMNVTKMATGITRPVISAVPKSRKNSQMMNPASNKPDDDRVAHAADGFAHDVGLVVKDVQIDARGQLRPERFDFLVHHVGDFHRVAVRLPADADQHGGFSVRRDHRVVRRRRRPPPLPTSRMRTGASFTFLMTMLPMSSGVVNLANRPGPGTTGGCGSAGPANR